MRWLSVLALLGGCAWITDGEQDARYDPDGDGVPWPDDCDDDDALVAGPGSWYPDADQDGFGRGAPVQACEAPAGHVAEPGDCDDDDASAHPGAAEVCDGLDQDCDGDVDDDATDAAVFFEDADGDGFGDAGSPVNACSAPDGYVDDATDCDDAHATAFPGGTEACDAGDVDEDCDGDADDADPDATGQGSFYADADDDGFGDATAGLSACDAPAGYVADATDCDDAAAAVNPGAAEVCDATGADEDCNGLANENDPGATGLATWYADADGDTFGDPNVEATTCTPPGGYVADATDCDDDVATTHPGAAEYCDGKDSDCDGTLDEPDAVDASYWHADGDGDGYGAAAATVRQCDSGPGALADGTDCDDANASVHPGATDAAYDGVDADCAGDDDYDADGDGYASDAYGGSDCDDTDPAVFPGRTIAVPGDASTIQAGIDLACDGDTVTVAAGTYAEAVAFGTKDVTVVGSGDSTVIQAPGVVPTVTMSAGTLESVRVYAGTNGGGIGGCIAIDATTAVAVRDVSADSCVAASGGGIGITGSAPVTIERVTLTSNTATAGGGLYADTTADLTLLDLTLEGNSGSSGGGLHLDGVGGTGSGLWIEGNTATTYGGAALVNMIASAPFTLSDTTIVGNTATSGVGGVYVSGETVTLEQIAVLDSGGAGASFAATGGFDAYGLVVAGGVEDGLLLSPLVSSGTQMHVENATIVGNGGDAFEVEPRKPNQITLVNVIAAWNGGYGVRDLSSSRDPDLTYSDLYSNTSGSTTGMTAGTGNISSDPSFVSFSTAMPAADADFHLRSASPAKDAGDSTISDSDGSRSDMGAFGGPTADASWYADADGDGLPDGWESGWGVSVATSDDDADGWTCSAEYAAGTSPISADTDGDGIGDGTDSQPLDPSAP